MAEPMTILEAAARAMCVQDGHDPDAESGNVSGVFLWSGFPGWRMKIHQAEAALTTLGLTPEQLQQPVGSFVVVPAWFADKMAEMEKAKEEHRRRVEEARASIRRGARPAGPSFTLSARPGAKEGGA